MTPAQLIKGQIKSHKETIRRFQMEIRVLKKMIKDHEKRIKELQSKSNSKKKKRIEPLDKCIDRKLKESLGKNI